MVRTDRRCLPEILLGGRAWPHSGPEILRTLGMLNVLLPQRSLGHRPPPRVTA